MPTKSEMFGTLAGIVSVVCISTQGSLPHVVGQARRSQEEGKKVTLVTMLT